MLSMPEIEAKVHRLAAMIGATDRQLPTFGYTDDGARPHIEVDPSNYHFVVIERGQQLERVTTTDLDELLYHVFDSVTFALSTTYASTHRALGEEFRRPLFARQEQLLGAMSPAWAARKAADHMRTLAVHPFDDTAVSPRSTSVSTHSIVPTPDAMVYSETAGPSISFPCTSGLEPPQVQVPTAELWPLKMPAWTHDRRSLILDRLRAARCVLFEQGPGHDTVESFDRTFRIEITAAQQDERGYIQLGTVLIDRVTQKVLFGTLDYEAIAPIRFPGPWQTDLTLRGRSGAVFHVQLDLRTHQWHLLPTGPLRPLSELTPTLFEQEPGRATPAPLRKFIGPSPRPLLGDLTLSLMNAVLCAGGSWVAVNGKTSSNRSAGVAGAVLFGLGTIIYVRSLRRRLASLPAYPIGKEPGWMKLASYLPLVAAMAEVPWCIVCFFGFLFMVGDKPFTSTPATVLLTKLIFPVPAVLGLVLGFLILAAGLANTVGRRCWLLVGMVGCGLIILIDLLGYIR